MEDEAAPTIFVSIPSYRDPEAPYTIRSLFRSASDPSRIHVGVCFQCDDEEDAPCYDLSLLDQWCVNNVRTLRIHWKEAKGPVWARHLIETQLFKDEDYFLQIDSHTRFSMGWDEELIDMLEARCDSPKPVITTYPLPYEGLGEESICSEEEHMTILCTKPQDAPPSKGAQGPTNSPAFGSADGMLRFRARLLKHTPSFPIPTAFWAAGFSFSSGKRVREVPYDPYLPFLFFGEEISMALRMWTRGYDLFAPDRHIAYHLWSRDHRVGTFWEVQGGKDLKAASQARVRQLLTGQKLTKVEEVEVAISDPSPRAASSKAPPDATDKVWGLGTARSLRMYEEFSGVDFTSKTVSPQAERGGMPTEECFWDRFASLQAMIEALPSAAADISDGKKGEDDEELDVSERIVEVDKA